MNTFYITYECVSFQNYEMPVFSDNNCLTTTWVIYLQHNAKKIIELENHEISLQNFKNASPYPRK